MSRGTWTIGRCIVFTGHRDVVADEAELIRLARQYPGVTWVEGEQRGFDRSIRKFVKTHVAAKANGITLEPVPARWQQYGRAAGSIRNRRMLDLYHPFLVVAGYDGREGGGTVDCMGAARERHIQIEEIKVCAVEAERERRPVEARKS